MNMERVSDERVDDMIAVCRTWAGSFAKDAAGALTELRERRLKDGMLEAINRKLLADQADATRRDGAK